MNTAMRRIRRRRPRKRQRGLTRNGKVLALLVVLMPAIFGMLAIVIDGSCMEAESQNAQHIADSAALAAAMDLLQGADAATAAATAARYAESFNGLTGASVFSHVPPTQGSCMGLDNYIEVLVKAPAPSFFAGAIQRLTQTTVGARAVAGFEPTTSSAGIVVLDPSPPPLSVGISLPSLPSLPAIVGGLEILGLGDLRVNGAVLVNTEWGGVDQNGNPAGDGPGPPYAVSCTPMLSLTKLLATDIRAVGGVDKPSNYGSVSAGKPSPLQANRRPIPDPLLLLPVPTIGADPQNVKADIYGGVDILSSLGPPVTLTPGVYDWIQVIAGRVTFNPGVYIVRNVNPITGVALNITGGQVTAEGVMFYVTNNNAYSPDQGQPDALDGSAEPPAPGALTLVPSVQLSLDLLGSEFSPIQGRTSPYAGVFIFQRRFDRRPIVLLQQQLAGNSPFSGNVYAKWGHVMLIGEGTLDAGFVTGTMRVVTLLDCTISTARPFPPAKDVFLIE